MQRDETKRKFRVGERVRTVTQVALPWNNGHAAFAAIRDGAVGTVIDVNAGVSVEFAVGEVLVVRVTIPPLLLTWV